MLTWMRMVNVWNSRWYYRKGSMQRFETLLKPMLFVVLWKSRREGGEAPHWSWKVSLCCYMAMDQNSDPVVTSKWLEGSSIYKETHTLKASFFFWILNHFYHIHWYFEACIHGSFFQPFLHVRNQALNPSRWSGHHLLHPLRRRCGRFHRWHLGYRRDRCGEHYDEPWKYPHKIWPHMVQYLYFRILKFPLNDDQRW